MTIWTFDVLFEVQWFDLKHFNSICYLIGKFCHSIWRIAANCILPYAFKTLWWGHFCFVCNALVSCSNWLWLCLIPNSCVIQNKCMECCCVNFCRTMLCKHGLSRQLVSVCLSRSWIMSKWVNISSKFFHCRAATPVWFFHTERDGDIPTEPP